MTLASRVVRENGHISLVIGHAIRNPNDNLSDLGELIATNRLEHEDTEEQIAYIAFEKFKYIPTDVQEELTDIVAELIRHNLELFVGGLK